MANSQNQQNNRQEKQEKPISQAKNVVLIGFIGGLFWSILGQLSHYFNFTEIGPTVVFSAWSGATWSDGFIGIILGIFVCGLAGIAASFLYYWFLRKQDHLLVSIIYGVVLWAIVHFGFARFIPAMPAFADLDFNTVVTTVCLYILFGVFVGVSVSFDETERQRQREVEQQEAGKAQS